MVRSPWVPCWFISLRLPPRWVLVGSFRNFALVVDRKVHLKASRFVPVLPSSMPDSFLSGRWPVVLGGWRWVRLELFVRGEIRW